MSWLMWLAVIVLVIAAIAAKVRRAGIVMIKPNMPPRPEDAKAASERMLCCEHCGVYIPESEVVHRSRAVFCSQEHGLRHFSH